MKTRKDLDTQMRRAVTGNINVFRLQNCACAFCYSETLIKLPHVKASLHIFISTCLLTYVAPVRIINTLKPEIHLNYI
jgi:hypothetical protein